MSERARVHVVSKDTAVPVVGDLETGDVLDRLRTGPRSAWGAFHTMARLPVTGWRLRLRYTRRPNEMTLEVPNFPCSFGPKRQPPRFSLPCVVTSRVQTLFRSVGITLVASFIAFGRLRSSLRDVRGRGRMTPVQCLSPPWRRPLSIISHRDRTRLVKIPYIQHSFRLVKRANGGIVRSPSLEWARKKALDDAGAARTKTCSSQIRTRRNPLQQEN